MRSRLILGLMSGTSHDGVDAVIARFGIGDNPARPRLLHHCHTPYPPALRQSIHNAFDGDTSLICRLNFTLGETFAQASIRCADEAGIPITKIAAIASHGQTVCHIPPVRGISGATLQIGEPAIIARRTGRPVISNFRSADIAVGGHGAPLVPYADWVVFGRKGRTIALHNLGGISNLTLLAPRLDDVFAFDTGPANCMIDEATQAYFRKSFDRGGAIARHGRPDETLLGKLMRLPYFKALPPKSTGRELFNLALASSMIGQRKIRPEDMVCTLTHLTARTIADAYQRFVFPSHKVTEIVFAGGGTANAYLMSLIRELMGPKIKVYTTDERYGIPSGAREALCFAVLANETLSGRPSNLPAATGARERVLLGSLTLP